MAGFRMTIVMPLTLAMAFIPLANLSGCERQKPTAINYVIKNPFDGARMIRNVAGAKYPLAQPDGSLLVEIDGNAPNEMDQSRLNGRLLSESARLSTGEPVAVTVVTPEMKYYFHFTTVDTDGNCQIEMHPLRK